MANKTWLQTKFEVKLEKCSSNEDLSAIAQANQHSTATEKNADRVGSVKKKRQNSGCFGCCHCGKMFGRRIHLRQHLYVHSKSKPVCSECGKVYKHHYNLVQHQQTKHSLKPHLYKCARCERGFARKDALRKHFRFHLRSTYVCNDCGKVYQRRCSLTEHQKLRHSGEPDLRYRCALCCKGFPFKSALRHHFPIHSEPKFVCSECAKAYRYLRDLTFHQQIDHSGEIYGCAQCEKTFLTKCKLLAHFNVHRSADIACKKCGDKFARPEYLSDHLKRMHPTEVDLKYECPTCNRRFHFKVDLRIHSITHSKVVHTCNQCDSQFKRELSLRHHKKTKHSTIPFTKFRCYECQQLFLTRGELVQHRFIHSRKPKFCCAQCQMSFSSRWWLRRHIDRSHNRAK